MNTVLLKNCYYIFRSSNEESLRGQDILIRGSKIEKISKNIVEEADQVIDCSQSVVVPGFVNTHHHFFQTLTRAHPDAINKELFEWLTALYPVWAKGLDPEVFQLANELALTDSCFRAVPPAPTTIMCSRLAWTGQWTFKSKPPGRSVYA